MCNFHFRLRRMGDYYVLLNGKSHREKGLREVAIHPKSTILKLLIL